MSDTAPRTRRWLIPTVTLLLLVLGTVTVTAAIMLAVTDDGDGVATAAHRSATQPQQTPPAQPNTRPKGSTEPGETVPAEIPAVSGDEPAGTSAPTGTASEVGELADPEWVSQIAAATSIPARALTAYSGASLAVKQSHPNCSLGWNTLAAIGLVESEHGSLNGSLIGTDGVATPNIIGVPLNGEGVAKIPDTDGGDLDGDLVWDRAVGPMQFLPSTWKQYATDGNGDGTPDIHSIDDASLTAAVYLCETGGDLTQPDNWIKAVAAYNAGSDYNTRVAAAATDYANAAQ